MYKNKSNFSENRFGQLSPIKCLHLNILSAWCSIILIASLMFNTFLIVVIRIRKSLRGSKNLFMTAFIIFNFLGSVLELPFMIVSNLYCR